VPEPRSALASVMSDTIRLTPGLTCSENGFADLVFVSAWPDTEERVFGVVEEFFEMNRPSSYRDAVRSGGATVFHIAPRKIMIVSESNHIFQDLSARVSGMDGSVNELAHGRVRIRLSGRNARALLARGAAVDFSNDVFRPGHFAQTSIHQIPVLVHRDNGADDAFDIYVLRSFALSFWHWLEETANIAGKAPDSAEVLAY